MSDWPRCLILGLCLGATPLLAQDVLQVAPQNHRLALDNVHARVFEVRLAPGERTGMHSHPRGLVYFLSDARIRATYPDGRSEERTVKAGEARWLEPVTHAIENLGASEFHEIHVELKD
ncbi:MAG: hypothetical protein JO341_08795 [Gammaproteobacteria bacterium]|nr:hypothetical protein [Gammaproteobacteria bacterium]MBV9621106.1 hypothetical protein [Gammaproteobacteria bacterium]